MDYTASIPDIEHRQTLAIAATQAASIASHVERQPTLSPSQREAVAELRQAAAKVQEALAIAK